MVGEALKVVWTEISVGERIWREGRIGPFVIDVGRAGHRGDGPYYATIVSCQDTQDQAIILDAEGLETAEQAKMIALHALWKYCNELCEKLNSEIRERRRGESHG